MRSMFNKLVLYFFTVLLGAVVVWLVVSLFGLALPLIAVVFASTAFFLSIWFSSPQKQSIGRKATLLVSILIIVLGLFAPCRAVMSFLIPRMEKGDGIIVAVTSLPGSWFEIVTGTAGVLFGLGYLSDFVWRMKTAGQVGLLAASSAASAAPGLAEFKGMVKIREPLTDIGAPVPPGAVLFYPEAEIDNQGADLLTEFGRRPFVRPFYLEDRTGRILVDASQAVMRQSILHKLLGSRICEIVLTRHRRREKREAYGRGAVEFIERWLEDGDPVYLIGHVEENKDGGSGSDRLVVRVSPEAKIADTLLNRFNLDFISRARRDVHDVFFLSDTDEDSACRTIRHGAWLRFFLSVLWIGLSLVLVARADLVK